MQAEAAVAEAEGEVAAAAAALSQKGGCPAEPAPCPCCCLLRLRQVVVDCLMLSKVLAVITLMCHFYSPATPYASPLHALSLPFLSLSLSSRLSLHCSYFIQHLPVLVNFQLLLSHSHSLSCSICHSVSLSLSLFGVFYGVCRHFAKLISGLFF